MACARSTSTFISLIILFSQYDWTKTAPLIDDDDLALLRYIANELPRQLDKSELIDDPYVRLDQAPEDVVRVQEGDSVTLQCEAIGIPPPVIYWRKQGNRLKQADHDDETNSFEKLTNVGSPTLESSTTVGRLRLDCVEPSMAGLYECVADNGYERVVNVTRLVITPREAVSPMAERCSRMSNEISPILSPPTIVMFSKYRLENTGNNVQLFCRATGYPKPQIEWFDADEQPLQINDNQFVLPNGDLFIKNVQGWGLYHCVATNAIGEDKIDNFIYATA